ncbi:MAG: ATP phosphoribosyltransferase [Clostridia bacterium]|nr:ATP phosphoribosyltransferase [Clostridia bacterium]
MITIALSKGRVANAFLEKLRVLGIAIEPGSEKSLQFYDSSMLLKFILVKADDVPTYVQSAVAELGVVGSDVLKEYEFDGYELLDLKIGSCKLCLAGPATHAYYEKTWVTVASKYPKSTELFLKNSGKLGTVIKLNGSVELGPVVGISDVIVDLVESGRTLRDNNLIVIEEIEDVSTRLISNPVAYKTKFEAINRLIERLKNIEKEILNVQ